MYRFRRNQCVLDIFLSVEALWGEIVVGHEIPCSPELHKWVGGARVGDTGGRWQVLGASISRHPPFHLWLGMGASQGAVDEGDRLETLFILNA